MAGSPKTGENKNDVNPIIGYKIWVRFWQNGGVMKIEDRGLRIEDSKDGVGARPDWRAADQSPPQRHAETLRLVFQTRRRSGEVAGEAVNKGDERLSSPGDGYGRLFLKGGVLIGDHLDDGLSVRLTHLKGIWQSAVEISDRVYRLVPPCTASCGIFLFFATRRIWETAASAHI
jgi:hypothetical protein